MSGVLPVSGVPPVSGVLPVNGVLPVSGVGLVVREPDGADELYLIETRLAPLPAMLGLARRVAGAAGGGPVDWESLPAADLDGAALVIRRAWLGDAIVTEASCPGPDCGERIDVSFGIGEYLAHRRPRRPRGVAAAPGPGWFTLAGSPLRFRIPAVADLLAVAAGERPGDALGARCVEGGVVSRGLAGRLDRAMSALAPSLKNLIGGACPGCGHEVSLYFDPLGYTLAELRGAFSGIHLEAHALATAYGWPEQAILTLPRGRRRRYAELIADERWSA
ncbi:MAG TPA: hypothetical protein VMF87_17655 [Streptosporangiaceae bacterium]|nr:hypothetical protein [Streptosporangiaceae bacterium]